MGLQNAKIDLSDYPSCVNFNLRKAVRAVSQHYDKILAPAKLRCTQFTILTILSQTDALTITGLAEHLVMDRTTLTRNLKPLEKEGYLTILPGIVDKRSRRIMLTNAGKEAHKNAIPYWQQAQKEMVSFMGKGNTRQLIMDLQLTSAIHQ
jgi:DNA-binding MarR family transcriptional regulator